MYSSTTLIGHLGQDPESKVFDNGSSCCRISVATNNSWKDANGEKQEKTTWHNVILWGKLGEIAQQYLSKGSKVMIVGRIDKRKHEDRWYVDIVANEMKMLDGKPRGENNFPSAEAAPAARAREVQNTVAAEFTDVIVVQGGGDLPF